MKNQNQNCENNVRDVCNEHICVCRHSESWHWLASAISSRLRCCCGTNGEILFSGSQLCFIAGRMKIKMAQTEPTDTNSLTSAHLPMAAYNHEGRIMDAVQWIFKKPLERHRAAFRWFADQKKSFLTNEIWFFYFVLQTNQFATKCTSVIHCHLFVYARLQNDEHNMNISLSHSINSECISLFCYRK